MTSRLTFSLFVILLIVPAGYAQAQTYDTAWKEVFKSDFEDLVVKFSNVKINNFVFSEDKDFMSGKNTLKFSGSATNRGSKNAYVSIQLVGFDSGGNILFALSVTSFPYVKAGKSENISKSVRSPIVLNQLKTIKYRIIIDIK